MVQWLGFGAYIPGGQVQSLVGELKSARHMVKLGEKIRKKKKVI